VTEATDDAAGDDAGPRTAVLETTHDEAALVAASLSPDDTDSMRTTVSDGRVTTRIERATTGGLQATVDDYVVNLSVADAVIDRAKSHVAGGVDPADEAGDAPAAGEDAPDDDNTQP